MRVQIAVIAGPHQGQVYLFCGHDVFIVGRSKHAHFRLPHTDEYFSRLHFLVEINPPHCRLVDLGSTNGTYVNGQKVALEELHDGDLVQGGQTVMRVSVEENDDEPVSVPAGGTPSPPPPIQMPAAAPAALAASFRAPATEAPHPPEAGLTAQCSVCASPAPPIIATINESQTTAGPAWPVCEDCRAQSRLLPQPFPNYLLVRELGRGGMGVVYLTLDVRHGDTVALKTIAPERQCGVAEVERFLREARILEQLHHRHVVAFREMGESCGQLYLAMDFVAGVDAKAMLERDGPLPVERAVHLIAQALEALHHAHQRGFVHRDVKPANLLVVQQDGTESAMVLDFGLARAYQMSQLSGLSMMGQVGGTVPFMAPEQLTNFRESRPSVDQYAAAATLYTLLTGKYVHDFPPGFHQRFLEILQDDAVPIRRRRQELPQALADVIHRALDRSPENRFPDAAAFRAALLQTSYT
jgi:serine/threonine-protein kinase